MSKNRVIGSFEDTFERGRTDLSNAAKQTVKDFTVSAKGQITGSTPKNSTQSLSGPHSPQVQAPAHPPMDIKDGGTNESSSSQNQPSKPMSDQDREEFLHNLYGKSDSSKKNQPKQPPKGSGSVKQALGVSEKDPNANLSPEEKAKLEALRAQLHGKYYQDLVNRPKPKEEAVAEKIEREDQEAKFEEIEKDKKKMTPSINPIQKQGTAEAAVGVSG